MHEITYLHFIRAAENDRTGFIFESTITKRGDYSSLVSSSPRSMESTYSLLQTDQQVLTLLSSAVHRQRWGRLYKRQKSWQQSDGPSQRASRGESTNMLSHEDDEAPHQTHPRTQRGSLGHLTMLLFHYIRASESPTRQTTPQNPDPLPWRRRSKTEQCP